MTDDNRLQHLQETLDQVHAEVRRTNGRVDDLTQWRDSIDVVLFGDKRSDGTGLVQQTRALDEMLTEWRALRKALYAVSGTLLTVGGGWLLQALTG